MSKGAAWLWLVVAGLVEIAWATGMKYTQGFTRLWPSVVVLVLYVLDLVVLSIPIGQLIVFAIAAIVVGILAAIFPARRASRLNVLQALQYE